MQNGDRNKSDELSNESDLSELQFDIASVCSVGGWLSETSDAEEDDICPKSTQCSITGGSLPLENDGLSGLLYDLASVSDVGAWPSEASDTEEDVGGPKSTRCSIIMGSLSLEEPEQVQRGNDGSLEQENIRRLVNILTPQETLGNGSVLYTDCHGASPSSFNLSSFSAIDTMTETDNVFQLAQFSRLPFVKDISTFAPLPFSLKSQTAPNATLFYPNHTNTAPLPVHARYTRSHGVSFQRDDGAQNFG